MAEYFVGALSGTSADGIDVVLVDFADDSPQLIAARTVPMHDALHSEIRALSEPTDNEIERLGRLDATLGHLIAQAINELLEEAGVANREVIAIGSHGQTLRHRPQADPPFTLQVGDPNTVAALTGITTVADFRRMDVALGGQGAPLAPLFHSAVFGRTETDVAVLNIGGIANLTFLPGNSRRDVSAFDTGPGNCLMDEWTAHHLGKRFDEGGQWAAGGRPIAALVEHWLQEPYFLADPPKSTGREQFNLEWMQANTELQNYDPRDVQASLLELTVSSVSKSIEDRFATCELIMVCGGGAGNSHLMLRLSERLDGRAVQPSSDFGIPPEWVEGCAFAYLARARLNGDLLCLPGITGASRSSSLGAIFPGAHQA